MATHIDAEHLHSHLIVNSVHPDTGKKLHFSPNTLEQMRKVSDQICMEHGLTTLKPYQQPLATADLLARWLNQTKDLHQGMCQDLEKVQRRIQEENRQAGKQRDEFMRQLSTVIERLRRDGEELQKSFRRWAATTIMCSVAGATVASILVWGIECFHGS